MCLWYRRSATLAATLRAQAMNGEYFPYRHFPTRSAQSPRDRTHHRRQAGLLKACLDSLTDDYKDPCASDVIYYIHREREDLRPRIGLPK